MPGNIPAHISNSANPGTAYVPPRAITIDVEAYYQIEAARSTVSRDQWQHMPDRVEHNMDRLLACFEQYHVKATLFFLGDIAQRHPQLVRRCARAGHEIASHGDSHERLHRLTPRALLNELHDSKQLLEDITGQQVLGFRAPTWSLTRKTAWAVNVLIEAGYQYDASIYPVRHPQYGVPDAPLGPYWLSGDSHNPLLELPPLVWRVLGRHIPVAGGGYFRMLPLAFMRAGLKQAAQQQRPAILYFHPWEFDPQMPRLPLPPLGRVRTYAGLRHAMHRLKAIVQTYPTWQTLAAQLPCFVQMADQCPPFTLGSQVHATSVRKAA